MQCEDAGDLYFKASLEEDSLRLFLYKKNKKNNRFLS